MLVSAGWAVQDAKKISLYEKEGVILERIWVHKQAS
jgi:hypothetical protein